MSDDHQQRLHAAEQLIMQTVKHHEGKGGIQAWNIANITSIDRELVDAALRGLVMKREVMLHREAINTFFLPYKEQPPKILSRMGRPRKELEAKGAEPEPSAPVKVRDCSIRTSITGALECNCPICRKVLSSTQKRGNLVTQLVTHMAGVHGYTREGARTKLEELGTVGARYGSAPQRNAIIQEAA